ncbi:TetR/AcrR family transcriptional regulator [Salsuginibacillus kocurii]|uniref:TetR/AcrR family transcriptional regulator n=1 Tax=Salsuginibacillus kocurii TaxID=427078 RepID=UPI000374F1F0|nr:TetR/AcrR family transcriptional regulator [Salsuginibacillus kocurii]
MSTQVSTREHILKQAVLLMGQKGYRGVTTKEIADASGVSEMTIFRHFGSKGNILQAAMESYSYIPCMEQLFATQLTYNLEDDLYIISKTYQNMMKRNQNLIWIGFNERYTMPEVHETASKNPRQLKEFIMNYFAEMENKGLLRPVDHEAQAMSLLWMNAGYFITDASLPSDMQMVSSVSTESFLSESISTFARGLKPDANS